MRDTKSILTHLISALVSDEYYKRTMVVFDIIVDQDRDPRIELFAHEVGEEGEIKKRVHRVEPSPVLDVDVASPPSIYRLPERPWLLERAV